LCHGNFKPTHMKAYAFIFAKTHNKICQCKSFPLANCDNETFYFAFVDGAHSPLLLQFFHPTRNPPLHPSNRSLLFTHIFPFFLFFSFLPHLLTKQLKNQKLQKKNALTKNFKWALEF
jgi:hypothetical protein